MNTFRYDYSKTLRMKMLPAQPDFARNTPRIPISFGEALSLARGQALVIAAADSPRI